MHPGKRRCATARLATALVAGWLLLLGVAERANAEDQPEGERLTPRAAVLQFLELTRQGAYEHAAAALELPPALADRGPALARRFKAVLDHHVWVDLDAVSDQPTGNPDDKLPAGTDELGKIRVAGGIRQPVLLTREASTGRWAFSATTVAKIDGWFGSLPRAWLIERLPTALLRPGPAELLYWQWLALPLLILVAWLIGKAFSFITRRSLRVLTVRTEATWDDIAQDRISGPLTVAWGIGVAYLLLPVLSLNAPALTFLRDLLEGALFMTFFWGLARSVDVAAMVVNASAWSKVHPASVSLIPLAARVIKVIVLAIAVIAFLSGLGYPVASLVAGLGIGGLALALAAQKTVENLFGAFSIGADQPFKEGDFVRIEDFVGTVESIGLRSTKIRTLDRTVITLPNGRLADMRLESLTERDRLRFTCTIGLVYDTTSAQMRQVLAEVEAALRAHPKIWPDAVIVRFASMGASSLDVEVMAWFQTQDWNEFTVYRQAMLLEFLEIAAKAGTSVAFPTRTLHLVRDPAAASGPPAGLSSELAATPSVR